MIALMMPKSGIQGEPTTYASASSRFETAVTERYLVGIANLGVDSICDLLPSSDLLRCENTRRVWVSLAIPRNLGRLGDNQA